MKAEAAFEITGWEQAPYDEPADGPPLTRATAWEGGQWGFVVPGSGTGELAGLRGEARLDHGRVALDYELG